MASQNVPKPSVRVRFDQEIVKLIQDEREQSAWCRDNPDYLIHSYIRLIGLACLTWAGYVPKWTGRALIIGLGGGILCRFLRRHFPNVTIDVIEPNHRVIEYAQQHFELDTRVSIHDTDGRSFLSGRTGTFDIVILDAFDRTYIPADLMTVEFLRAVERRLRPRGLMIANTWVLDDLTRHENATYLSVFQPVWDFRKIPNLEGNRIILHNPCGADRLDQILDLVKDRAACADQRMPLQSHVARNKLYYSGFLNRLHIQKIEPLKSGFVLSDANVEKVRAESSFDC